MLGELEADLTVEEIRSAAINAVQKLLDCEAITAQEKDELRHAIQVDLVRLRDNLRAIGSQIESIEVARKMAKEFRNDK